MLPIQKMIAEIEAEVGYTVGMTGRAELSEQVREAMSQVARHMFVDPELMDEAYDNYPLPIGYDQTISQPYMVAIMTDLLEPKPHHRVLEIGCGSGYQAAILSLLVKQVISLEIVGPLAQSARERLARLGYHNVEVIEADGQFGWEQQAPYDGIIVTAAPEEIPQPLIDQLAPGGHLIIPVGARYMAQELLDIHKVTENEVITKGVLGVSFVPLIGGA